MLTLVINQTLGGLSG